MAELPLAAGTNENATKGPAALGQSSTLSLIHRRRCSTAQRPHFLPALPLDLSRFFRLSMYACASRGSSSAGATLAAAEQPVPHPQDCAIRALELDVLFGAHLCTASVKQLCSKNLGWLQSRTAVAIFFLPSEARMMHLYSRLCAQDS